MSALMRRWPLIAGRPPIEPPTLECMERDDLIALVRELGQQKSAWETSREQQELRAQSLEEAIGDMGKLLTTSFTAIQKEHIRITRIVMRTLRMIDASIVSGDVAKKEPGVQ